MGNESIFVKKLDEQVKDSHRLGRHIEHDERSKEYAYASDVTTLAYVTVHHRKYGPVLDQGDLGSCTGNATAGAINTVPLHNKPTLESTLHEQDALELYELATKLDSFEGQYPPDDTGSSGLAAAKAAKQKGHITSYKHAFSLDAALAALQKRPIITGVNWYEGFDNPDSHGTVKIDGEIRGGHEFVLIGFQLEATLMDSLILACNSWGPDWGLSGRFNFTVATWRQLLDDSGDATILLRS